MCSSDLPNLELSLFDLPTVAAEARAKFAADPLTAKAHVFGGNFFTDPLPAGADLISLVRIVHDHDEAPVLALLRSIRKSLAPGGVLLIAEPMSGTVGAERVADAYFGFYLLAMGSGRPRNSEQIQALLTAAGFGTLRMLPTRRPFLTRLLIAS